MILYDWKSTNIEKAHPLQDFSEVDEFLSADLHCIVVNWNRSEDTIRCLGCLLQQKHIKVFVHVLDNGSHEKDYIALKENLMQLKQVSLFRSAINTGFAVANNFLMKELFYHLDETSAIACINNDAFAKDDMLSQMLSRIDFISRQEMIACAMMKESDPEMVDNLGNTLYCSGITSNRKEASQNLLCPCAGAALYSVRMLKDIQNSFNEIFDEDFFCYVEDSDMGFRARALGYRCVYVESAIIYHRGSASTGGPFSPFVMYHGLRNSLWFLLKSVPLIELIKNAPFIIVMQWAVLLRYITSGNMKLIFKVYFDAWRSMPLFYRKRKKVMAQYRVKNYRDFISRQFYDKNYIADVLIKMWWCPNFVAKIFKK